jgi:hypothetical protein
MTGNKTSLPLQRNPLRINNFSAYYGFWGADSPCLLTLPVAYFGKSVGKATKKSPSKYEKCTKLITTVEYLVTPFRCGSICPLWEVVLR